MSNTIRERLIAQNAKLIRTKQVEVKLEDGSSLKVEVRAPTMGQTAQFTAAASTPEAQTRSLVKMVIATTFDIESGNPIFTLADEDLLLQAPANGGWMAELIEAMGGLYTEVKSVAKN